MKELRIIPLADEYVARLEGHYLPQSYQPTEVISGEDTVLINPGHGPVALYLHRALPSWVWRQAYPALKSAASLSGNRGMAAGGWYYPLKEDGTRSRTKQSDPVHSGSIGHYRYHRDGCRKTKWTVKEVGKWKEVQPLLQECARLYAGLPMVRDRYEAQMAAYSWIDPSLRIPLTPATTVAVNLNFATSIHKDRGDYRQGLGVLAAFDKGIYEGGFTVLNRYRVGFDIRAGDVLVADFANEYHANTPLIGKEGDYERLAIVMYLLDKMRRCGSTV